MTKRILALLFAAVMLFSFAACGGEDASSDNTDAINNDNSFVNENGDFVFRGTGENIPALGTPEKQLDAQAIYNSMTYVPEMFWGDYGLKGGSAAEEQFGKDYKYAERTIQGEAQNLTVLPMRIKAGADTFNHVLATIEGYNWCEVYFMRKYNDGDVYLDFVSCAYEIEDNKLLIYPLDKYEYDKDTEKVTFAVSEKAIGEYEFSFRGRELTLKAGDESVTLITALDPYREYDYFFVDHYCEVDSPRIGNFDLFHFSGNYDESGESRFQLEKPDDIVNAYEDCIAVLGQDGLFTFTCDVDGVLKTYQYVYFYCGDDGVIFTDGETNYLYTMDYSEKNKWGVKTYLSEDQTGKLDALSEAEIEEIAKKTDDLMADLEKAFNDAGISVTVDSATGEMAMNASVLFDGDSAVLKDAGKDLLNKFTKAYTEIAFSEKYDGFIQKTLVEGHTAPVAGDTYEDGYPLSVERAENVLNYCVSKDTGVDTTKLASALEAVGCSNVQPVKDAQGNVDMDASRRVSFRFIINIG